MIPKPGGKRRRLGIPTVADRVVQAALKLVLEPIFEADFQPCSYGFRPRRRAQDAIAEIHLFSTRNYEWVLEADITACFDEIDHTALMGRVRRRIGDKRVLALVKAFLQGRHPRRGWRRTGYRPLAPRRAASSHRCSPTSPSRALDEHFARGMGGVRSHTQALGNSVGAKAWLHTGSSATRTTSWCWWPAPAPTPKRCATRWRRCSRRWACACRMRRRGSPISTRASTSSASASSGKRSGARANVSSTPTDQERRSRRSRARCGR